MNTAPRKPGRPSIPDEKHRRVVTARLLPELIDSLTAAANSAGHSVSREIEVRCQAYETLRLVAEFPVNKNEEWLGFVVKQDKATGKLDVIQLAHHAQKLSIKSVH